MNTIISLNENGNENISTQESVNEMSFSSEQMQQAADILRGFKDTENDCNEHLIVISKESHLNEKEFEARIKLYQIGSELYIKLSSSRKAVFTMYLEGKSVMQIAKETNTSYQNVSKLLKLLKKELKGLQNIINNN